MVEKEEIIFRGRDLDSVEDSSATQTVESLDFFPNEAPSKSMDDLRREKNRLRQAAKRSMMTPEEKALFREKNRIRARLRRRGVNGDPAPTIKLEVAESSQISSTSSLEQSVTFDSETSNATPFELENTFESQSLETINLKIEPIFHDSPDPTTFTSPQPSTSYQWSPIPQVSVSQNPYHDRELEDSASTFHNLSESYCDSGSPNWAVKKERGSMEASLFHPSSPEQVLQSMFTAQSPGRFSISPTSSLTYNISETPEQAERRRMGDRARAQRRRAEMSEEMREREREACRVRAAMKRASMTAEEKAAYKERNRQMTSLRRASMTPELKAAIKERNRLQAAARRAAMTPEQREEEKRRSRIRVAAKRAAVKNFISASWTADGEFSSVPQSDSTSNQSPSSQSGS